MVFLGDLGSGDEALRTLPPLYHTLTVAPGALEHLHRLAFGAGHVVRRVQSRGELQSDVERPAVDAKMSAQFKLRFWVKTHLSARS